MPEDQLRFQDSASREDLFNIALTATVHLLPKLFQNVFTKYAQDLSQTRGTLFALRFSPALQTRVSRTRHGHHRFQGCVRLDDAAVVEPVPQKIQKKNAWPSSTKRQLARKQPIEVKGEPYRSKCSRQEGAKACSRGPMFFDVNPELLRHLFHNISEKIMKMQKHILPSVSQYEEPI